MQILDRAQLSTILPSDEFRQMSALGALSDSFVESVLAGGELLQLAEGETLYRKGERADCFYIILKGQLAIYQDTDAGREIMRTTNVGESVGFPAMLAMRPRLFNGDATSECIALKISCQALAKLQELDSQQFGILFINLSRDMSRFLSYCILRPPAEGA
jgi:CRP-like cAMP-binding protein